MNDIDSIMEMLDWNNTEEEQEKGRRFARNIKSYNVFLQPHHNYFGKNVWTNCSMILAEKTDIELRPYLYELFKWLEDINWPGADNILNRLMQYAPDATFYYILEHCIKEALAFEEDSWLIILRNIKKEIAIH